ncbi:MAG: histidine kinase, partial [Bradyrhizobium sp.]|nr:histidine kinase [Bradyrhizobium sp.]
FAVVASEVKSLANQAKQATDTISSEIDALNSIAAAVATSLSEIKAAIAGVNEYITSTAAAVEEQSIVTQDMSTNMQRASAELAA